MRLVNFMAGNQQKHDFNFPELIYLRSVAGLFLQNIFTANKLFTLLEKMHGYTMRISSRRHKLRFH